ncbi:MAG: dihydrolipoamide acetyltransferase family protein [Phycisphaerae bacterium]|jgi:pyruvate dehydrogenase E2 component (dihydrolipoamide acetyltransferase)
MPIDITMPRLSDTMQQGTIVKWNVKEGQKVKSGDVIADIETDKATMELQSFDDGVVAAIPVPQGQTVPVGTVMLVLATAGEDVAAVKAKAGSGAAPAAKAAGGSASNAPAAAATAVMEPTSNGVNGSHGEGHGTGGRIFISPLARKIADEAGLDVSRVQGSGPGGRIVRKDVEEAIAAGSAAPRAAAPAAKAAPSAAPAPRPIAVPAASATLAGKLIPVSNMRRVIAQRLSESKSSIPHYQVSFDVDMQPLMALRAQLNEQLANQGVKLSVNDFLVKACALAMHQHPYVNARWVTTQAKHGQMDTSIEYLPEVNVGIAIALPINEDGTGGGLVVATLRNADSLGLRQISAQSKQLAEKARGKGLAPSEMSDSTFTISNLGMYGVSHFNAIINPPNVAILAVGGAIEKPVVRNGKNGPEIVPGLVMTMTMSSDHRVVDGAMAAQYLSTVKNFLEKPATLLV